MPRAPRIDFPGLPQHLVVRGNDRNLVFFSDQDRLHFLKCLGEAREKGGCDIHAFVLMSNHVHILVTPRVEGGASRMIQDLGRAYVRHVNNLHSRSGTLYEGRFKSSIVETARYFLACMRYIEMNPVRARLAQHPASYRWSSFGQNITGDPGGLVTPHAEYLALGRDPAIPRAARKPTHACSRPPQAMRRSTRYATRRGRARRWVARSSCADWRGCSTGKSRSCLKAGRDRSRDLSPFS
jgi:putative transposase